MNSKQPLSILLLSALLAATAAAQNPQPFQTDPSSQSFQQPGQFGAPARPSMRLLFAQTLAAATQAMGSTLILGVSQALVGGLTNWFERRTRPKAVQAQQPQPFQQPQQVQQPQQSADFNANASNFPTQDPTPAPQFFDAQTGQPTAPDSQLIDAANAASAATVTTPTESTTATEPLTANESSTANSGSIDSGSVASTTLDLFAGLAFEVHMLTADGQTVAVNPATHEFRTGDRFVIFFRPTLPGRMEVYNVNAAGQQTQIDLQTIAAGQLAKLGPYEFAAMTGDEQLKLVIIPCSSPELAVATRDIVNVATTNQQAPADSDGQLNVSACQPVVRSARGVRTRDIRTRDIRRVALEGNTGFALDPISNQERSSGNLAPREVSIVMRHR